MAATGKEGKEKKAGKEDASVSALRRITEELASLRADIDSMKAKPAADPTMSEARPSHRKRVEPGGASPNPSGRLSQMLAGSEDAAVSLSYAYRITEADGTNRASADDFLQHGLDEMLSIEDVHVARLGYAFSSAPKVAILRILLTIGAQSAAQIGERANLTTGSLYHHLRELTHAAVIESSARNRFELTEIGRQTTLLLFVQSGRL